VPSDTSLSERVLAIVAEVAEADEVRTNPDINLYDTHLVDSIKMVELIMLLSDRLGLEISPAELDRDQWSTPGKIVQYCEARMTS
jgi:D-alanine--poly(phosphoribitol) ligase subunit 2